MRFADRVLACLQALAIGDALGKQTESLSHAGVGRWYPNGIAGFEGRPGDIIPRYAGQRYQWRIGETTDDTEQTLAVARAILRTGEAHHEAVGSELLRCRKSVHPGVRIWDLHQSHDPARIAAEGDGCGAAMRAAPIGMIYQPDDLPSIVRAAYEVAIPTHGGPLAICAAAAVAAAVASALDGGSPGEVLRAALQASRLAETLRPQTGPRTMTQCIEAVFSDLDAAPRLDVHQIAQHHFPDRPETIVPLAIALALRTNSAEQTALLAANLGGDADSVASIGSAIAGALNPASVNPSWLRIVTALEDHHLPEISQALADLHSLRNAVTGSVRDARRAGT